MMKKIAVLLFIVGACVVLSPSSGEAHCRDGGWYGHGGYYGYQHYRPHYYTYYGDDGPGYAYHYDGYPGRYYRNYYDPYYCE